MKNVLERLINLLVMLLTASRPVPADEIRRTIPGYSADSDDAFHRMFERDKELLRGIGIPIELRPMDGWEVEHGYVVDPEKYRMADPGLTDEERVGAVPGGANRQVGRRAHRSRCHSQTGRGTAGRGGRTFGRRSRRSGRHVG